MCNSINRNICNSKCDCKCNYKCEEKIYPKCFYSSCCCCPPGLPGLPGDKGSPGELGEDGEPGLIGPQGPKGLDGETGPQGPTGNQGPIGEKCVDGTIEGPMGPQGLEGPAGPAGPAGPQGPRGSEGQKGLAGSQRYAHFYALDQIVNQDEQVKFITGVNSGVVTLSADGKQLRVESGAYIIASSWTTSDDGALSMVITRNGVKIPYMNYIVDFAKESLTGVIPGYLIIWLNNADILRVTNYGTTSNLTTPENNISKGSTPNSAATISFFKLSNYRVS